MKAFVSGGSRGLGLEICRRLLSAGWRVWTCSRSGSDAVRRLETERSERFAHIELDFEDSGFLEALKRLQDSVGGFDAVVANAAIGGDGSLTLMNEASIRRVIEVNLTSPILMSRELIKGMLANRRGGAFVFVSSIAAKRGYNGLSVYSATKSGICGFSRTIAREYGKRGIRSNVVLPGFLETEMTDGLGAEARERIMRRSALGRLGTAKEVAGAVEFLLSEDGGYVTGAEWALDGGTMA